MSNKVPESDDSFQIGTVKLIPVLGDITKPEVDIDVLVHPAGIAYIGDSMRADLSLWVQWADIDRKISTALQRHIPLKAGEVVITPAYNLPALYMLHAVVVDWKQGYPTGKATVDEAVEVAAKKCIEIAVALGVQSIAFTPWGTRVAGADPAQVTAIMTQAITSQIRQNSGQLEKIYLISNNPEHYQLFIDRAFIFRLVFDQVDLVRDSIAELNIPESNRQHIFELLGNLQKNVVVYNEIVGGDKIEGDKINANVTESSEVAVGKDTLMQSS